MLRNVTRAREDKNEAREPRAFYEARGNREMVIRVYRVARVNSVYVNSVARVAIYL